MTMIISKILRNKLKIDYIGKPYFYSFLIVLYSTQIHLMPFSLSIYHNIFSKFSLISINLLQHDGCDYHLILINIILPKL